MYQKIGILELRIPQMPKGVEHPAHAFTQDTIRR